MQRENQMFECGENMRIFERRGNTGDESTQAKNDEFAFIDALWPLVFLLCPGFLSPYTRADIMEEIFQRGFGVIPCRIIHTPLKSSSSASAFDNK